MEYAFQYTDTEQCPEATTNNPLSPVTLTIPEGGTAQKVLEASVGISSYYRFSATYFGSTLGYFIDTINGTTSDMAASCYWFFYVQEPGKQPELASVGVSNYIIPTSGYSILMRYQEIPSEQDAAMNEKSEETPSVQDEAMNEKSEETPSVQDAAMNVAYSVYLLIAAMTFAWSCS